MEFVWSPLLEGFSTEEGKFRYYGTADEQLEMTTMKDTANFVAAVSVDRKAVGAVKYRGDSKSFKKLARSYQEAFGVEPNIQRLGSLKNLHDNMTSVFKRNPRNGLAWTGLYGQYWMSNGQTLLGDTGNGRYPKVVPTTAEEFLKGHTKENWVKVHSFENDSYELRRLGAVIHN
ncbi:hypothetical protein EAE96_011127 [Botrytis aclada]|nr:hypothetical protein EAE96_011127 [Botrytis aclada]